MSAHESSIEEAIDALLAGEPVVIPTDTVYGIAVDPTRPGATDKLFAIKERPVDAALPVLAADRDQAFALARDIPSAARRLADRFWPGGLTLVIPRRHGLAFDLGGADDDTIGLRVPDHPIAQQIAARVGPIAATSANLHGRPTPATAAGVATELGDRVAIIVDGGVCEGLPSTVLSCSGDDVVTLREGRVSAAELRRAVPGAMQ